MQVSRFSQPCPPQQQQGFGAKIFAKAADNLSLGQLQFLDRPYLQQALQTLPSEQFPK